MTRVLTDRATVDVPANGRAGGPDRRVTRLLVVEDSPSDFAMLVADLRDGSFAESVVDRASTLHDAVERLQRLSYDAVLCDLGLPDSDGLETFEAVFAVAAPAAVVVLTGLDDARLAEIAVRDGAQDYLVKGDHRRGEVGRAVRYAIRRKELLDAVERARDEQLAAKDRFLSHVSHELRTPLAVVHQFGSLLLDGVGGELSADQHEYLTILMSNVGQLKMMIDDLLEVSHSQRGSVAVQSEHVELTGLLAEAVKSFRPLAAEQQIMLELVEGEQRHVFADGARVREVMSNLLDNSLKFTPPGGVVTVSATRSSEMMQVTVADTGRGIESRDLPHIFEQFYQVKHNDECSRQGLGLGLFVCRDLIERQGGEMSVDSAPGLGTSISFSLPLDRRPAVPEVSK